MRQAVEIAASPAPRVGRRHGAVDLDARRDRFEVMGDRCFEVRNR
jgi:hypothetical protein